MKKGKLWEGRERKRGEDDCYQLRVDPAAARAGEGRRGGGGAHRHAVDETARVNASILYWYQALVLSDKRSRTLSD